MFLHLSDSVHGESPWQRHIYRPQQSCGKVMFLHLSVILFMGGLCQGDPPGWRLPGQRLPGQRPPLDKDPLEQRPPGQRHPWTETHPLDRDPPPGQRPTPLDRDPPETSRTETSPPPYGSERAVGILLECILVSHLLSLDLDIILFLSVVRWYQQCGIVSGLHQRPLVARIATQTHLICNHTKIYDFMFPVATQQQGFGEYLNTSLIINDLVRSIKVFFTR